VPLAGAVLLDINDEWQVADRRYFSEGSDGSAHEPARQWERGSPRARLGGPKSLRITLQIPTTSRDAARYAGVARRHPAARYDFLVIRPD
jgi:hypothetical protein